MDFAAAVGTLPFQRRRGLPQESNPTLKGAAQFLQSNLFEFPVNGNTCLVTGPSSSPENSFLIDGKACSVCAGPYMDTEICSELFIAVMAKHTSHFFQVLTRLSLSNAMEARKK